MTRGRNVGTHKTAARVVAALMLTATATYMLGTGLLDSVSNAPDYLLHAYADRTRVVAGVLLQFVDAVAVAGIGIVLYPILRRHNETIALGYAGARIVECLLLFVAGIASLSLITLSRELLQTSAPDSSSFQAAGAVLVTQSDLAFQIAMLALALGSLPFCYLLYRSEIVPGYLAILGFVGYASLLASTLLAISGYDTGLIPYLPGALFELIFPIRLIVRGFDSPGDTSELVGADLSRARVGAPVA